MKKIISILMCLLLLGSTSGVAYAQHFCGDFEMISEITLGQKNLSCGMVTQDTACGDEHSEKDHNCCDNDYTKINTDDTTTVIVQPLAPVQFVVAYIAAFPLHLEAVETSESPKYTEYNPPPLIKDVPVLYETFLI